jgi:ubiquinone/menaquinone biosynthesis C-methylase UbiE
LRKGQGKPDILSQIIYRYLDHIYQATVQERHVAQGRFLEEKPGAIVLDCGTGDGNRAVALARHVGTHEILGLDLEGNLIRQAQAKGVACLVADLNEGMPVANEAIDVLLALDVVEHLVHTSTFIREAYRVLVPGGYALIATPNLASWHNIFALLLGLQPFSGPNLTSMADAELEIVQRLHRRDHDLPETAELDESEERSARRHIVVVAYRSLVRVLRNTGFKIELAQGFGYYPFLPVLARLLARLDPSHAHHILIRARKPVLS